MTSAFTSKAFAGLGNPKLFILGIRKPNAKNGQKDDRKKQFP